MGGSATGLVSEENRLWFNCRCCLIFPFLWPQERDSEMTPGKQTEQINNESLFQRRLHISTAQKEIVT